jgi:light-regulated signal transduction histidine kinase (bacteriophytochrome)
VAIDGRIVTAEELALQRSIATGLPVVGSEQEIIFPDGERRFIYGNATPVLDDQGRTQGAVAAFMDITDRKLAEQEIQLLNDTLEQRVAERTAELAASTQALESFCYSISHDLRTPLRSIDGFNQALLEDYSDLLDDTAKDYLQRARRAAQRMGRIIDDLLNLARVTRSVMNRKSVNLEEMARRIVAELQRAEPERQIELTIDEKITAFADARLILIALTNLLDNAWKFTKGKQATQIRFGTFWQNGEHIYFVKDNGAGFDMIYVDKLFHSFQRLHPLTEFPGSGMGLATVQRIIRRHGGRIWADAKIGTGATFCFTLA